MSKKKNRPTSAQNLIDSLLDEKTPPKHKPSSPERFTSRDREAVKASSSDKSNQFSEVKASTHHRSVPDPMDLTRSLALDLQTENPALGSSYHRSLPLSEPASEAVPPTERPRRPAPPPPPTEMKAEPKVSASVDPVDPSDERTMRIDVPTPKKAEVKPSTVAMTEADATSPLKTMGPQPILTRSEIERARPGQRDGQRGEQRPEGKPAFNETIDRMMPTEIKTRAQSSKDSKQKVASSAYADGNGLGFSSAEAALKQSESLRIAQKRITDLEQELERLRRENENLGTAGDTLRRRSDELLTKSENLEIQARENDKIHEEEKKVFRSQIQQKDRDLMESRNRLEEMEGRLENNFKKIRVRERELEHRLEIIKMESATLVSGKDKMILDLKRQLDQVQHENDYGKQKSAELYNQYQGKQDTIRRVVRALRIALTILEGDEDAASGSAPRSSKRDE